MMETVTQSSRKAQPKHAIFCLLATVLWALVTSTPSHASTAYGDLNNFDVFNDTGQDCHGFEIELEDIHSTDVTYTYDWNHYGAPAITEDNSNPAHPKVTVRYAAKFNGTNFSAYTAIPASAPAPTDGHQCTNPSVNYGCEHFGVGYYGTPSVVRYHWLIEDPILPGTLRQGPAVNIATPSWTYNPPAGGQAAQVQAVVLAPPPPPAPVYEFGDAVWVKAIVTTSHNNGKVELKDLVSDDPDDPDDKNWTNGEPDEVEIEWHILQTEFSNPDGNNNDLAGAPEELNDGDEVVTRRYEFYKYAGPLDPESNEASCDNYPQVSDPNDPSYKAECDPAVVDVMGDYIGAQMAGFNVEAVLGLIDHIEDGEANVPYTDRTVVVGGNTPYMTQVTAGSLPAGLSIDSATGVLSGAPLIAGDFAFTITATDADAVEVSKSYSIHVAGLGGPCEGVVCTAIDSCHAAGVCDPATGLCSNPNADDGTACDDGDACTQTDSCQAGACIGADPVTCTASDDCHLAGSCDTSTGVCSDPVAPDGTACDDGDGCPADSCIAGSCEPVSCPEVDIAVLPRGPLSATIAAGKTELSKTWTVKVRNAASTDQEVALTVDEGDCPAGVDAVVDFDAATATPDGTAQIAAGKAKSAKLSLTIRGSDFNGGNPKAPARCRLMVTASAVAAGGSNDPSPSNNVIPLELNVIDKNDAPPAAVHESVVASAKPKALKIRAGAAGITKTLKVKIVNADLAAENPGDSITLSATASCGGLSLGTPVCDTDSGTAAAVVAPGKARVCTIAATATAAAITTPNPLAPERCLVTLTAAGPSHPESAPLDPSNNHTTLVVDLLDAND